jgi:hypothetical protein
MTFGEDALSANSEATDLAYLTDGTLGIEQSDDSDGSAGSLMIIHPDGSQTLDSNVVSVKISADGNGFLANDDQLFVPESGSTPQPANGGQDVPVSSGTSVSAEPGRPSIALTSGSIAYPTVQGVVIQAGSSQTILQMPSYSCPLVSQPYVGGSDSTATTTSTSIPTCVEEVVDLAAGPSGGLFVLTNASKLLYFAQSTL